MLAVLRLQLLLELLLLLCCAAVGSSRLLTWCPAGAAVLGSGLQPKGLGQLGTSMPLLLLL
jgi:hypothetical protein